MLTEYTQGIPVRTFSYDGAGRMIEATVFTLTTRFTYNGLGARVAVEVVGHGTTTYTLDYAAGNRVLAETTGNATVHYLYPSTALRTGGHDCLGELRDDEWLYYLNDATGYLRQGADMEGEVVSGWLFDPNGVMLEGPEGPVSHLICGGVYDWSTGLIHKDGRYFDPMLGIWLALMPLIVVQSWKGRKKRRGFPWYVVLVLLVGVSGILTGCIEDPLPGPGPIPCVEAPSPIPEPPTGPPEPLKICDRFFPPDGVSADERYKDYGFLLGGFNEHEIQVLGVTIQTFADHVGGSGQLNKLVLADNGGLPQPVCKDPVNIGCDTGIRLGTTAFDKELAIANRQGGFGAKDNDQHGQISFGHEIGHHLINVLRPEEDWAEIYKERLEFPGPASDAEQTAVTDIALYVLAPAWGQPLYFWEPDPSLDPKKAEWAEDFLEALKKY